MGERDLEGERHRRKKGRETEREINITTERGRREHGREMERQTHRERERERERETEGRGESKAERMKTGQVDMYSKQFAEKHRHYKNSDRLPPTEIK